MSLFGVHLTVLLGATVPLPASPDLLESLDTVEIKHSEGARSGFQIVLRAARSASVLGDYPLLRMPELKPGVRVILMATLGIKPTVLMDGIITNQQLSPGKDPGEARLTITGEDLTFVMDREEKNVEHPAQNEAVIAAKIILSYARYGLVPMVIPPPTLDVPVPTDRIPVQQATDLKYLEQMGKRFSYVFHVTPGPLPGTSRAYWGPPLRLSIPQRALSVNMGPDTNVNSIDFQNDAPAATTVKGTVQDRQTNQQLAVRTSATLRPPLAQHASLLSAATASVRAYRAGGARSMIQALTEAQATTDSSTDTVTAEGELDTGRYGGILDARAVVGLRGAGMSYDGLYYVKGVTHKLAKGSYTQKFSLVREGLGTTIPAVLP